MHILSIVAFSFCLVSSISGHGRLIDPAARNAMWRFGFPNPANYNDNGLNCGGYSTQWSKNSGKCGICGDAYHLKDQPHNDGGRYANGIIAKTYKRGEVIEVEVHLTSNHQGWFEFRIGKYDDASIQGDAMGRLKGHLLEVVGAGTRFNLPRGSANGKFKTKLRLPADLLCKRCVMQWWYNAGNNWDCDSDGCGVGHGKQEHFVNCADVKIVN
eukprot:gene16057-17680_t